MDDPKLQAWRSPVQQELEGLLSELAAFNERIAELVRQGHRGHALNVLTAQALSLASQIDELRCLLVVPKPSRLTPFAEALNSRGVSTAGGGSWHSCAD